mgnify:CR=1 FL=1
MSSLFSVPTIAHVGISFSDTAIRFVRFETTHHTLIPVVHAEYTLPDGAIQNGHIIDTKAVTDVLVRIHKQCAQKFVALNIPFEVVELAMLAVPKESTDVGASVRSMLAERTSLDVSDSIIGYKVVAHTDKALMVQVSILAQTVAKEYLRACLSANLMPIAFEYEGHVLARALLPTNHAGVSIIVSIGAATSALVLVSEGVVYGHKIISHGTETYIKLLMKERSIDGKEAMEILETDGVARSALDTTTILIDRVDELKDMIESWYIALSQKKGSTIGKLTEVIITGASIPGLTEYLSAGMRVPVSEGNPWRHCFSFDAYIPALTHTDAQRYSGAIGVTLPDGAHINLLPVMQRKLIARTRQMKKLFLILTIIAALAVIGLIGLVVSKQL